VCTTTVNLYTRSTQPGEKLRTHPIQTHRSLASGRAAEGADAVGPAAVGGDRGEEPVADRVVRHRRAQRLVRLLAQHPAGGEGAGRSRVSARETSASEEVGRQDRTGLSACDCERQWRNQALCLVERERRQSFGTLRDTLVHAREADAVRGLWAPTLGGHAA